MLERLAAAVAAIRGQAASAQQAMANEKTRADTAEAALAAEKARADKAEEALAKAVSDLETVAGI